MSSSTLLKEDFMISVNALSKSFRVSKRDSGFIPTLKAFFNPKFETVNALTDISFHIPQGEIVGYIGPNGAGKSTTIKILSGILVPDKGQCQIHGRTPWLERKEHVKDIGVVFGQRSQLWWDVPVIDSFRLLKDIYAISEQTFQEMYGLLSETLDLAPLMTTPVRQLSLGQRMRCEIAASLLHNPSILFLDEPTIGLDAVSKIAVRNFIKNLNREKKTTIILTTHDTADIEALASRILLIGRGKLLLDGNLEALKAQNTKEKKLIIDHLPWNQSFTVPPGMTLVEKNLERHVYSLDLEKISVSSAISEISRQVEIKDLTVLSPPIESLIVKLYEDYAL